MKYEDLSFTLKDDNGEDITCDILSVVPNEANLDEPYVVFTDYMLDEDDEFVLEYGKLVKDGEDFNLVRVSDPKEIDIIKDGLKDDITAYVNKAVQENLE